MKNIVCNLLINLILLSLSTTSLYAWTGRVTGITDGDTIKVIHDGKEIRIRLYGIDTPEKKQAFGTKATQMTKALITGRTVEIKPIAKDRYGRTIAMVYSNGTNVNEALIRDGMAWVYKKYCKKDICSKWYQYEANAKRNKKGMWVDSDIEPPWIWRHAKKKKK